MQGNINSVHLTPNPPRGQFRGIPSFMRALASTASQPGGLGYRQIGCHFGKHVGRLDPFDFDDSKTTWPDQICQELEPLLKDLFSEGGPFLNDMYKPGPAKFPPRTMRRVADWVRFRYPGIADLIPDNRWQKFVEGLAWEYRMNGIF